MMKQEGSSNELVWVCEACEHAPAAFFCKADSASLCATCDADIHSANPLAHRHHRVPIYGHPSHDQTGRISEDGFLGDETTDEDEAASWLLLNPPASGKNNQDLGNNNDGFLPGEEADEFLDLFEYNSGADNHYGPQFNEQKQKFSVPERSCGGDSVVPVQYGEGKHPHQIQFQNFLYDMEFNTKAEYNNSASVGHTVSVSSMDVGVVPESATMSEISMSHPRLPNGTINLFSSPPIQVATQLSPLDREARVMRYREKKKKRKFEKTIRYASRKAYAETRPRIKGRFAKRTDVEAEVYPNGLIADSGYAIVPSF